MPKVAKYFGLIPAGGSGQRFGASFPKQYADLGGVAVLQRSVQALLADPRIEVVYVVVAQNDSRANCLLAGMARVEVLALAGPERANTVLNALTHLLKGNHLAPTDWVLVHDAARPGLSNSALARLIDHAGDHPSGGLLALPVVDTLKRATVQDGTANVQQTVPRAGLWAAQTPQMFRAGALGDAIAGCLEQGTLLTDDASAMECLGHSPLLVPGHIENMKITLPADLEAVAKLLGLGIGPALEST
ncbi:MAG TPA: 2-C-methyl-D-erythritol 4-phosphate cytidylyltransferase [Limnobacter sp.]|nr:2-C-methyl-D-erythritol 4-phosphate cytidylyltransferase [Limnobacter sp.]